MNAVDLMEFLGHSSIYEPFEDFLDQSGIKWRPKLRNLDTTYFVKDTGIVINFTTGADLDGIAKKSEGTFIFHRLSLTIIEEDKADGHYTGVIPQGLLATDKRVDIHEKLGPPLRGHEETDFYFLDDLFWVVAYEGENLSFIQLQALADGWREIVANP